MTTEMANVESFRYPNAPIAEAIIELRVSLADDFDFRSLVQLCDEIKPEYPERSTITKKRGGVSFSSDQKSAAFAEQEDIGYKSISEDRKQIAQFRVDGFIFNRLAPYEDWNKFSGEAKKVMESLQKPGASLPNRTINLAIYQPNRCP